MCRKLFLVAAVVIATMAFETSFAQSTERCNACSGTGKIYCCVYGSGKDAVLSSELNRMLIKHGPCKGTGYRDCYSCCGSGRIEIRAR